MALRKTPDLHSGHRARMKQEFLEGGLDHFSDVHALELLLFFSRPQGDVNPLAHTLLDTFGSLSGVLDADPQLLAKVPGMGEHTITLLKLVPALSRKYLFSRTQKPVRLQNVRDIQALLAPYFYGATVEMSYMACLDNSLRLLGVRKLGDGGPDAIDIQVRKTVAEALSLNASVVILSHNHITGDLTPSDEDLSATYHLKKVLGQVGINLYDHVILTDDDILSMRNSGFFRVF